MTDSYRLNNKYKHEYNEKIDNVICIRCFKLSCDNPYILALCLQLAEINM